MTKNDKYCAIVLDRKRLIHLIDLKKTKKKIIEKTIFLALGTELIRTKKTLFITSTEQIISGKQIKVLHA